MIKNWLLRIRLSRLLLHTIGICISFWWAFLIRQSPTILPYDWYAIPPVNSIETIMYAILSCIIFSIIGMSSGIYELEKPLHWYFNRFIRIWWGWIVLITFMAYFWQWFIFNDGISRFIIVTGGIWSFILLSTIDGIINTCNKRREQKHPYKILLLCSDMITAQYVIDEMKRSSIYEYNPVLLDHYTKSQLIKHDIIIVLWNIDLPFLQEVFDHARLENKQFFHIAEWFFIDDIVYHATTIGWITAFEYRASTLDGWATVLKRLFDIISSVCFIILFWRIFVGIALYIRIKDGRPIIYASQRVGRRWDLFWIYKFRTMIRNADQLKDELINRNERKWPLFKIDDDPRILSRGKFLRKRSLDELPQIRNIVTGTMSVVWPRPHISSEVSQYKPRQKRLLSIKPWITWYAQVFGRHSLNFDQEATLDLHYIQNWTLFLDIYVIVTTIRVLAQWK